MQRTLIKDSVVSQEVKIKGYISARRDHGKISFLNVRDYTGEIQVFCRAELLDKEVREESAIEIIGVINKRPDNLINKEQTTGEIELEAKEVILLSKAEVLPFEIKDMNVSLPTLFDHRPLTLRNDKVRKIFKTQEALISGFRNVLKEEGFTEFQSPAIVGTSPEGGSEVFKLKYYDYDAYLAQSPQVYKQIMLGSYERVFTVAKAYRAEHSMTSRHLSEYISLDAEMSFIDSWEDIINTCEKTIKAMIANTGSDINLDIEIPRIKLIKAQEIIDLDKGEPDLSPEGERKICEYVKEKYNSDFVFITHFPTSKRPFYTFPNPENPNETLSFDLLFKGLEIITGGQRINDYNQLVENIKKWGNDEKLFEFYLQAFKYGMAPEGGFAIGTERVTKQLLDLSNVSEASLFPRDMERIDQRLSSVQTRKK